MNKGFIGAMIVGIILIFLGIMKGYLWEAITFELSVIFLAMLIYSILKILKDKQSTQEKK